mgnify:CR=1 FL=1
MSRKDEDAIYETLRLPPAVKGPEPRLEELLPQSPKSACGTFELSIAGMDGLGACYNSGNTSSSVIAVIISGPELGFAILFSQSTANWQSLKDKVIDLAPSFKLERAEGDAKLMQWIR